MGANQSGKLDNSFLGDEVNFDHFQILRAIGKGSFGKVCIVQKKDSKQMFAMKYMNKHQCMERDALKNVLREVEILTMLEHPFLVNLWFSFQDEEDLFMVSDLLLGGDLRYHIQHEVLFTEDCVKFYVCELALALDYLQSKKIIHRDIKPDNILLDEDGHVHITDFNIATVLDSASLATSMSGTKPYIAPEIFDCAVDACVGYSYPVDWWSLGVVAFEMLRGRRPFDIHSNTSIQDVRSMFQNGVEFPEEWSRDIIDLLSKLLNVSPGGRVSTLEEIKKIKCLQPVDMEKMLLKQYRPKFTPPRDHLNCDPTFELEEMIIETKPLHKKKKRLAKQRSIREVQTPPNNDATCVSPINLRPIQLIPEFKIYNRYQELERREREKKEQAWEKELLLAMNASDPLGHQDQTLGEKTGIDESKIQSFGRSCPMLDVNSVVTVQTRLQNSPRIKNLRSHEAASFPEPQNPPNPEFACPIPENHSEFLPSSSSITPEESQSHSAQDPDKSADTKQISSTNYNLCGMCTKKGFLTDEVKDNVPQLEYIDRTPSPTECVLDT